MNILYLILVILLTQILAWFQTYGQIKWELMSNNFWLVVLMGLPISYLWMKTATYSFVLFDGKTWPLRFIGFAIGIIVFSVFSRYFLNEVMTTKTAICLSLSILILVVQLCF